jgi:hypothetical protein
MADGDGDGDRGDAELDHGVQVLSLFDSVPIIIFFNAAD